MPVFHLYNFLMIHYEGRSFQVKDINTFMVFDIHYTLLSKKNCISLQCHNKCVTTLVSQQSHWNLISKQNFYFYWLRLNNFGGSYFVLNVQLKMRELQKQLLLEFNHCYFDVILSVFGCLYACMCTQCPLCHSLVGGYNFIYCSFY